MDTNYLIKLVNDFGFPVVLTVLMGGFIWYMFKYVTTELKPKLGEANGVLIGLIDRIRMMDNDLIRLKTKIETVKNQKHKLQKVVKLKTKE
jgi:hypothetical protein|tara:strand:+ start:1027 stop:1299 length:273 start_codon:yes stop_codon:yes gene_type:complete